MERRGLGVRTARRYRQNRDRRARWRIDYEKNQPVSNRRRRLSGPLREPAWQARQMREPLLGNRDADGSARQKMDAGQPQYVSIRKSLLAPERDGRAPAV